MIHLARPIISPVENIVFTWDLFCLARFWKVTDGQIVWKQWLLFVVIVGRPSESNKSLGNKTFQRIEICDFFPFV